MLHDVIVFVGLPFHVLAASAAVFLVARFGVPTQPGAMTLARRHILPVTLRSFVAWVGWCAAVSFASEYWKEVGNTLTPAWPNGPLHEAVIDLEPPALMSPVVAGLLAYLLSLLWIVRRRLGPLVCQPGLCGERSPVQARACTRCGYHAAPDRPCPECGLDNPLALRRVYFGRWHARLMLSRWRWLAVLPWALVAVLFCWPLISGVARHWLV